MISTRYSLFGAAVIDNRIFVVGGFVDEWPSTSVESLEFPTAAAGQGQYK